MAALAGGVALIALTPPATLVRLFGVLLVIVAITVRPRFPAMERNAQRIIREHALAALRSQPRAEYAELAGRIDELGAKLSKFARR